MTFNILEDRLVARQAKIQTAKDLLARTQTLFDQFGSAELKTSHARFAELLDALNAGAVRLVVLGEFSRGKSSLINALLGIKLLPTAMEATTAINTFVRMLPSDRKDRFIRIHFQDGTPPQEVPWTDDTALKRWGTELDESHAHIRQKLDYIEAFMNHPLLANELVLVDTPGLQSVMAHHEAITRKAIAEAHIALWLQNTSMLGGAATEWEFLSDTIRNNFRKFITVIGWWDKVLDPQEIDEKNSPIEERIRSKLEVVKKNFKKYLQNEQEVEILTDLDHLIPVSAHWAMSDDADKRAQSGIDVLSRRIADMFSSDEAVEQIYGKPLQQLSHIQQQLAASLTDALQQLVSDKSLAQRARELENFDLEIQNLKTESEHVALESKLEHDNAARALVEKVKRELIAPLAELKADIENQVDARYVQRQIEERAKTVKLPDDLDQKFQIVSQRVAQAWKAQKTELGKALDGLSADYRAQMEKHALQLRGEMSKMDVDVPSLDISFKLDFSEIEQHHQQALTLNQEIAARQEQIDGIETDISKYSENQAKVAEAKRALLRAERMVEQLGNQPAPITAYRSKLVKEGGTYSSDVYRDVPYTDDSNVKAWQSERAELLKATADKEARMQAIMAEEERKTGLRMSLEKAQKKYEREMAEFEKKKALYEQQAKAAQQDLVQETMQRLIKNTVGQLDQRMGYLQNHVSDAIQKIFSDQLQALQACVDEQYLEPLSAKRAQREEIQALLQQGEAQVAQRKAQLQQAQKEVSDLMAMTQNALQA